MYFVLQEAASEVGLATTVAPIVLIGALLFTIAWLWYLYTPGSSGIGT